MSGELLTTLLESLQNKNSQLLNECLECNSQIVADVLKDLPVAKCELLLSYIIKKMKNHKLQVNCMFWITQFCTVRIQLCLQNKKIMELLQTLNVQHLNQNQLIGKLEMIIQ